MSERTGEAGHSFAAAGELDRGVSQAAGEQSLSVLGAALSCGEGSDAGAEILQAQSVVMKPSDCKVSYNSRAVLALFQPVRLTNVLHKLP